MSRIPVGILGATGTVGQTFIERLTDHPQFEVAWLAGSPQRIGQCYGETVNWRGHNPLDPRIAGLICQEIGPDSGVPLVFSALDAGVARDAEPALAQAGRFVVSNASAFRMADDVPLIIPEVNPGHMQLLVRQRRDRGWSGGIIANPNCATATIAVALAPLHRAFGLKQATLATLQAASGAGYPGVPSMDLLDNVIPYIAGEEEKLVEESRRLLGRLDGGSVIPEQLEVTTMVHRVPVTDGHMVSASLSFDRRPTVDEVSTALANFAGPDPVPALHSSPEFPLRVDLRLDRPQPRLDRGHADGMAVTVGRIRECSVGQIRLTALSHNLIRGAAGAAIQNAELALATGAFEP